jgi:hypothetical protein
MYFESNDFDLVLLNYGINNILTFGPLMNYPFSSILYHSGSTSLASMSGDTPKIDIVPNYELNGNSYTNVSIVSRTYNGAIVINDKFFICHDVEYK